MDIHHKQSSKQHLEQLRQKIRKKHAPVFSNTGFLSFLKNKFNSLQAYLKVAREFWNEYKPYLEPYRSKIFLIFLLSLLGSLCALATPLAIPFIIDKVIPNEALVVSRKIFLILAVVIGAVLLNVLSETLLKACIYLSEKTSNLILLNVGKQLCYHLLRLPFRELQALKAGGITSRLLIDVEGIQSILHKVVIGIGNALLRLVLIVLVIFFLSWQLALVTIVLIPGLALFTLRRFKRISPFYKDIQEERAQLHARMTETFQNTDLVRISNTERYELANYTRFVHTILRKKLFIRSVEIPIHLLWGLVPVIAASLITGFGAILVVQNMITLGDLIAFQVYIALLTHPISELMNLTNESQDGIAAWNRIQKCLCMPLDKPDQPNAVKAPDSVTDLRFDDVHFAYNEENRVLHTINFTLKPSQVLALVGRSGAGKSTLVNLMVRFYDPSEGAIFLNGIDIRNFQLKSYRRLFGLVQQDIALFDGTVRENIAYGCSPCADENIKEAALQANAHEFIENLPQGYDTRIGERGVKLSGGQRQRLSIARAYLADPQILIMDEATSNLDTENELIIQKALHNLCKDRMTIVIAHRLSTIKHADSILFLEKGHIIERGNHTELMNLKGAYFQMVEKQQLEKNIQ